MNSLDHFHYHFIENNTARTIFLFHGTGADEKDLVPLVEPFVSTHNIVGLRGNVSEHGMTRFFQRRSDGSFVLENLEQETQKVAEFIEAWYQTHATSADHSLFIGYSNGANFIVSLLFSHPELVHNAALLHALMPIEPPEHLGLASKKVFVSWGEHDQMIPEHKSQQLIQKLQELQAEVEEFVGTSGHALTFEEVRALQNFIASNQK